MSESEYPTFSPKDYALSAAKKFTGFDAYQRERSQNSSIDEAGITAFMQIMSPAGYSATVERPHHQRNKLSILSLHLAVLAEAGIFIGAWILAYEGNPEIALGVKATWNAAMALSNAHTYRRNYASNQVSSNGHF
ncbi:MAG TPA: hypothetical protein VLE91_04180 [Candidatus Saccharimonadales bacterium]|nr:hypothetical protein [Candidatus Saccharimonadales bacterium]